MKTTSRFELKYILGPQQYLRLKNALIPYMTADYYTKNSPDKSYLVRSLYFDTWDYAAYREKDDGHYGRIKLRIRTYTDQPDDEARLSVELKTRLGNAMEKHSVLVPYSAYDAFIRTQHWPDVKDPVLLDFERLYHLKAYRPKTIIEYRREGFIDRDGRILRLTFDHRVKSAAAEELFPRSPFYKPHTGDNVIFEVKCGMEQPAWLHRIIRDHNLKLVSNSKYAQSIALSRPDIIPSGYRWEKVSELSQSHALENNYTLKL